jgi:hypothetical protein
LVQSASFPPAATYNLTLTQDNSITSTPGGYLTTYTGNSTTNIDAQCAAACIVRAGANYFGTVNSGTTQGDCYCGNVVTTAASSLLTNCVNCNGQTTGLCGRSGNSIAIYSRSF